MKDLIEQLQKFLKKEAIIINQIIHFSSENIEFMFADKQLFLNKVNTSLHKNK